jgi:UDP-N-acetylmuramoyl-L-alanyl-D-glutamate--2,6-diaminopimelate ligase
VRLDQLIDRLDVRSVVNGRDGVEVIDATHDSRAARAGSAFVCVPGARVDGHDHAASAVAAGATLLVCERALALDVPQLLVTDARASMGPLADAVHGEPTRALRVVGITGTNGKTTTSYLVRAILEAAGIPCGLLGTVEQRVGGRVEAVERTTPEATDLHRTFRRMLAAGDRACAMEVSSHALALHRVAGVRFGAAAFTNLTQDHLDFHPSLEDYFLAKARLFDGRCPTATNIDDAYGRRLTATVSYSTQGAATVAASEVELRADGTRFRLDAPDGSARVAMPLRGAFNVSNALAAASAAHLLGIALEATVTGLESVTGVPGRMEPVDAGQPFAVIVDYAHTPDALETVLRTCRGFCSGRLRVVFGCGGDRDASKRPIMGAVAARLADDVLVTSDNPRSEPPEAIIAAVLAGMPAGARAEPDRREAIRQVLGRARAGDVVVVAGKGHEQGQERDGRKAPFDDRAVVRELLA